MPRAPFAYAIQSQTRIQEGDDEIQAKKTGSVGWASSGISFMIRNRKDFECRQTVFTCNFLRDIGSFFFSPAFTIWERERESKK